MTGVLFSHAISVMASSEEAELNNPELTAFLVASALGGRTLEAESKILSSGKPIKSPNRAFLSSLVVPGSGQLHVGANRGYLYIAADIALLVTYFMTHNDAENTRDDYRAVVRQHVVFDGPGTLETWDPIEDFEHATLFDNWHNVYTEERYPNDVHLPLERTGKWYWDDRGAFKDEHRAGEDDSANREEALHLREDANDKFEVARTLLGGVILNHLISAVEARITTKHYNKKNASQSTYSKPIELSLQTTVAPSDIETQLVLRGRF